MLRRIIKIAVITVVCTLLILGTNFGVKKLATIKSQEEKYQQEALKNKECKNIFEFDCPKNGGDCKMVYKYTLYECTKEGRNVYLITKIIKIVIAGTGIVLTAITIYKNNIL